MLDLVCEKYRHKMPRAEAVCAHSTEYCKFRSACIIHFLDQERRRADQRADRKDNTEEPQMLDFSKGEQGLLPAIVQDQASGEVLMLAYINDEAWRQTIATGKAHYWSRSRRKLWLKGESSGHVQLVKEILVDCDADTVVLKVEQLGGAACHTGHRSCFYRRLDAAGRELEITQQPVFDPAEVYKQ